ncbi:hypothetical protein [Anaerospora hongkongensis]|uniref:hypothetical protein n=1 Tax=Anaerospora hongkongensis TaxID=244830 RepID=UPI0028991D77|nr:hypothetical protein [Anaerospora hongkongensis]
MKIKSATGLWQETFKIETASVALLLDTLKPFEKPLQNCYECGVELLTLPCVQPHIEDLQLAAPYLKRTLNDLRAIWHLLLMGYTSQAGSVAAATFEYALLASCLPGHPERTIKLKRSKSGDSPWTTKELCIFHAMHRKEESQILGTKMSKTDFELIWTETYGAYKWLCKIKHPTLSSTLHDLGATSLKQKEYVVMASPDIRKEDTPVKFTILSIIISRIHDTIRKFALRMHLDRDKERVLNWTNTFNMIIPECVSTYKSIESLPFTVSDSNLKKRYYELKHTNLSNE